MAARAMWKGVVRFGKARVPVKLYAAIEDRSVHFRLLHAKDNVPVKQVLVNPETDAVVSYQDARRAFVTDDEQLVMLNDDELEALSPAPSRDIEILAFLPHQAIDHRWYRRAYYLGPGDGGTEAYSALTGALAGRRCEGLARWVMRKKEYVGALRLHSGYPMLIALRHADEVVAVEDLEKPEGPSLDAREVKMARQLVGMLEASFDPGEYRDEYRARVLELIETKARGEAVPARRPERARPSEDLLDALAASLKEERKRA